MKNSRYDVQSCHLISVSWYIMVSTSYFQKGKHYMIAVIIQVVIIWLGETTKRYLYICVKNFSLQSFVMNHVEILF